MRQADWESFQREVTSSPALRARLQGVADWPSFVALVLRLGAERGYRFEAEDVQRAAQAGRRAWLERWL